VYTVSPDNPLSGFQVQVYEFATRRIVMPGRVDKPLGRSLDVSSDGRWLTFQDYPSAHLDVILVDGFH
jgi:hypothetical protein